MFTVCGPPIEPLPNALTLFLSSASPPTIKNPATVAKLPITSLPVISPSPVLTPYVLKVTNSVDMEELSVRP